MNTFKYAEKLNELYSEWPYTRHLESIINILPYFLYHMSINLSIPAIYPPILFFEAFQGGQQTSVPLNLRAVFIFSFILLPL